jgi:hypothetical protein
LGLDGLQSPVDVGHNNHPNADLGDRVMLLATAPRVMTMGEDAFTLFGRQIKGQQKNKTKFDVALDDRKSTTQLNNQPNTHDLQ